MFWGFIVKGWAFTAAAGIDEKESVEYSQKAITNLRKSIALFLVKKSCQPVLFMIILVSIDSNGGQ